MRRRLAPFTVLALLAAALVLSSALAAGDPIFSGPQPGEKTTSFKVIEIGGGADGTERDPVRDDAGAPTVLVFVHTVERSLLPLLRVIEQYGVERKERIKTEVIFLAADRRSGEERVRAVQGSLKLRARVGLSPDGAEGPGNFGLNKECMMTIVAAKDNVVTANFALVQPGIADAPKVIAALAKTCGDAEPPNVEALTAKLPGARAQGDMKAKEPFPGAVPTDAKLNGLLREFIRPTNDDATADRVLAEVKAHIAGNADLKKQALDGWTRVLHFGDAYGTPYSRKIGQEFLDGLKAP
ncbi:MAG TPA: hypothetical protein VGO11_25030 [Chthoniobacteraceae bacterium]|nr:hypothetical protein [Chthoniobacteraceae bacterium]